MWILTGRMRKLRPKGSLRDIKLSQSVLFKWARGTDIRILYIEDPLSWKELISLMVYFLLNLGSLPCTLCFMFYLSPILVFLKLLWFKIGIFPRFIFDRIWLVLPCLQLRFSADFSQLFGTIFVQRESGLFKILFLSSKRNSSLKFQWRNCRSSF